MLKINNHQYALAAVLSLIAILYSEAQEGKDYIFQTSTIGALMQGDYNGILTFGELKKHGDFGLGTFNDLDGEMVGLDGIFYQVNSDGEVSTVPDSALTPFAAVTFFETDQTLTLSEPLECKELEGYLEKLFPTKNIFYAIKVEGSFDSLKARSVPRQKRPYPPLAEVVKRESIFEFNGINGTMVGFRLPEYLGSINATGFHFHFISEGKDSGGHVLDCKLNNVSVEIDQISDIRISLPDTGDFYRAELSKTGKSKLENADAGEKSEE
ncbi:MAG: acetolactate decarboxylase [Deltaproteobacteria bacterium]